MIDASTWLVFDLGGVIVDVAPPEDTLSRFAVLTETAAGRLSPLLREQFASRPWSPVERFQVGEIDLDGLLAEMNTVLTRPLTAERLVPFMESMLRGVDQRIERLLHELTDRHQLACYSNTSAVHWDYMRRQYGFFDLFSTHFASHELGYAKPDLAGFDAVAERLGADPGQCVLIDDRAMNVVGARAAGWEAIAFRDADQLRADLYTLGAALSAAG